VTALLDRFIKLMRDHLDAEAQLRVWAGIFLLCFPLYPLIFMFGGSILLILTYELSVAALHLTAMAGITAAEAVAIGAQNGGLPTGEDG
jgi:hypothetical protein